MKKIFLLGLVITIMLSFCSIEKVIAEDAQVIKNAIAKYKNKNFVGCISDLKMYTEQDPSNAVAWYYLANSYMNIAMKDEAHAAFEKVIELNTVPKLTSYSIQAEICMENPLKCNYQNFTKEEIKKLKQNPNEFLEQYFANLNKKTTDEESIEIENLIKGSYPNNIHPSAKKFIDEEKIKIQTNQKNSNNAYIPSDDKLSQALNLLKESNNEISSFAMLMDTPNQVQNSNYAEIIEQYYGADKDKTVTPEMVQLMMMQSMMPNF
ncbi:MAG: tetratricopeptide repeat protein [Candidatus Gastranaerophilales bacterium]|nr:tetratricopeptide repeat protein [Candidatus Gastranaerophilales bacterium]